MPATNAERRAECGSNLFRRSLKDAELIDHSEFHIDSSLITNYTKCMSSEHGLV